MSRNADQAVYLSEIVGITERFARSVNLERDLMLDAESGYVVTPQAVATLTRLLHGVTPGRSGRAWTITGPYGTGKSAFALYLTHLLCTHHRQHGSARKKLEELAPDVALQAALQRNKGKGFLPIGVTGHRTPVSQSILAGMLKALNLLERSDAKAKLSKQISGFISGQLPDSRTLTGLVARLTELACNEGNGYSGILLILDELGKNLEFMSRDARREDVFVLQELAELAHGSSQCPILLVGILHQAFDQYASWLDGAAKAEWSKVQGRFEDIPYHEPADQVMALIAGALQRKAPHPGIESEAISKATEAFEAGFSPQPMSKERFVELCAGAYPLSPGLLVALPIIFRRFAQNERSIFSYLAAQEPFGLRDLIQKVAIEDGQIPFLNLADFFDYLEANLHRSIHTDRSARRLAEVVDALERAPDLPREDVLLLKTLGILNILSDSSHIRANSEIIRVATSTSLTPDSVRSSLDSLLHRKLVTYRKYNDSYVIWEGSDFDIPELIREARRKAEPTFDLATAVEQLLPAARILPRRHNYQTGTLKYLESRYVGWTTKDDAVTLRAENSSGIVLTCFPDSPKQRMEFEKWLTATSGLADDGRIIGVLPNYASVERLQELMLELTSIEGVSRNIKALQEDRVARRELAERSSEVQRLAQAELDRLFGGTRDLQRAGIQLFWRGQELVMQAGEAMSHVASRVCDQLYDKGPRLWNELLNRNSLSSAAAKARRNLIESMILDEHSNRLNIEGYPPEASMYETTLRAGHIHKQDMQGTWRFGKPAPESDSLNILPAWETLEAGVFDPEGSNVDVLRRRLMAAPFGLTDGLFPVLLCAFVSSHQEDCYLFREGTFLAAPGIADWETLLRRPEQFVLTGVRIDETKRVILDQLGAMLKCNPMVVPIAKGLVRFLRTLSDHALRTKHLSAETVLVREALTGATAPERLIFAELPNALGIESEALAGERAVRAFARALEASLDELSSVTSKTIEAKRDELLRLIGNEASEPGWDLFVDEANRLAPMNTDPQLTPILNRCSLPGDRASTVEGVLAVIAGRPPRTWADSDVTLTDRKLTSFARAYERLRMEGAVALELSEADLIAVDLVSTEIQKLLMRRELKGHNRRILGAALLKAARHFVCEGAEPGAGPE